MKLQKSEPSMLAELNFSQKAKTIYFFMIATLVPVVRLQIISNATFFDFINVVFILFFLAYFFMQGKLQIPLLIPISVILIASLFSMLNSRVPMQNSLALIVDLYLFLFFIVLYNVIETKQELRIFILFWLACAVLLACFMSADLLTNITKRSIGTFLNPNMASSYLGLSFFLLFQPYAKVSKLLTWLFGFIILGGIVATKSLAGLVGFFFVIAVMMILYWYRTRNFSMIKLLITILIVVLFSLVIFSKIAKIPNLFDRFQRSSYARMQILQAGLDTFMKNPLGSGIGPGGFREVGPKVELSNNRVINMELHSDWFSFLVERGIFGFIGIVLLFWGIGKMLFETTKLVNSQQEVLWTIGLYGMFIFILSFSLTHEVLHFRHIWCAIALIAVEYKLKEENKEERQLASVN